MSTNGRQPTETANRIAALRLFLHRELDRVFDVVCDPNWAGTVGIQISGRAGRPGEPRVTEEKYGVCGQ